MDTNMTETLEGRLEGVKIGELFEWHPVRAVLYRPKSPPELEAEAKAYNNGAHTEPRNGQARGNDYALVEVIDLPFLKKREGEKIACFVPYVQVMFVYEDTEFTDQVTLTNDAIINATGSELWPVNPYRL